MRNYNAIYLVFLMALITSFGFFSCDKSDQELSDIIHYKVERINEHNFSSEGWKEQQVNIASNVTSFLDFSDHIEIVCGPDNTTDPRLKQGAVTMNLPTSADPTLRRIRLRRGGYSGTFLADLTELKYSTYVVQNAPTNMVIQIDVNGDDTKDFNIFYEPRENNNGNTLELNRWQQWNALAGNWHVEVATVPIPQALTQACTIAQVVAAFPNARIIDTEPMGHNGEGVRFTIGGTPASLFANTISYFDALIIGTRNERHSTLFDFTCNRRK